MEMAKVLREAAEQVAFIHREKIIDYEDFGAAEDFAHLMTTVQKRGGKGTYYMLGADRTAGHHDDHFDFDEAALAAGVRLNSFAVMKIIGKKQ